MASDEPPLTGSGGSCADSGRQAAEQQTQSDGAACAEPGSHIIQSAAGRVLWGGRPTGGTVVRVGVEWPKADVTGAGQRETGRCASVSARTGAGVSAPASRGACLVSSCSPNQALILVREALTSPPPPLLNQLTSALPCGTMSQR